MFKKRDPDPNFDLDLDFDFEVKRSARRKTLCLQIRDGHVQVVVPTRTPERQINALVNKHKDWVRKKLGEQLARPKAPPKAYVDGEIYGYLGQDYRLKIVDGAPWPLERVDQELVATLPARLVGEARTTKVKARLHEWYLQAALEQFQERTEVFSRRLDVTPTSVKVKSYKRRWGSCSTSGEISYNWRLVIGPAEVMDYVVVHEVSHMLEHNHSPAFWRIVKDLMPNYREQQAWLNKFGGTLAI
jgi:predicted metal-dependent hydrolase